MTAGTAATRTPVRCHRVWAPHPWVHALLQQRPHAVPVCSRFTDGEQRHRGVRWSRVVQGRGSSIGAPGAFLGPGDSKLLGSFLRGSSWSSSLLGACGSDSTPGQGDKTLLTHSSPAVQAGTEPGHPSSPGGRCRLLRFGSPSAAGTRPQGLTRGDGSVSTGIQALGPFGDGRS